MCGILGIAFLSGHKVKDPELQKTLLKRLLVRSKIRGSDATGVAFVSHSNIAVIKHNINAIDFINTDFYAEAIERYLDGKDKSFGRTDIILGHTRLQTKGSHHDRNNNHPVVGGKIIGIHNGNISNDDILFDEYIKVFPDVFKRKAWVDTEIIFRLINHYRHFVGLPIYEAILATSDAITGSYACAFIDAGSPWMLYLFRDYSPTDVFHYPKCGLVIFASTEYFVSKAVAGLGLGDSIQIKYDRESCLTINTISNTFNRFPLNKRSPLALVV